MGFIKIAFIKDLGPGEKKAFKIKSKEILIVNLDGKYYALGNICTHLGCKLSNGTLIGENVECPCHGSTFDIKTGKVVKGPAKKSEPTFKVKMKSDQISVDI